jgi:hypothetical protein
VTRTAQLGSTEKGLSPNGTRSPNLRDAARNRPSKEPTLIYALCDPRDDSVRYIGKTIHPLHLRFAAHMRAGRRAGRRKPVHNWINGLLAIGQRPYIRCIQTVPCEWDWQAAERFWIAAARRTGYSLMNLTDGGEGVSGHVHSQEHKEKIAQKLRKGSWHKCLQCSARFWRKPRDIRDGNMKFCSRTCYAKYQTGKPKNMPRSTIEAGLKAVALKRKTILHCRNGHLFSVENTRLRKNTRICKTCESISRVKYLKKRGEA